MQVESAVYVGITLTMDISEVPAVTATAERAAWETTVIDELTTVLSPRLSAAQEAAGCDESCGKQLRFIGVYAASVLLTIQILPVRRVCALQATLLVENLAHYPNMRLDVPPNSRER